MENFPEIQIKNEPNEYSNELLYDSITQNKVKEEPVESVCDYDYFSPEFMASIPSEPLFPDLMKTDSELFSVAEFLNTDLSLPNTTVKTEEMLDENIAEVTVKKEMPPACTGMVNLCNFKGNTDQSKNTGKIIIAKPKKPPSSTTHTITPKPYAKSTNTMECQYCGAKFSSAKWFSKHFCPQMGEQLHGISVVNLMTAKKSDVIVDTEMMSAKQRNVYGTRKCRVCDQSFPTFSLMFEHFMSHYNLNKDGNGPENVQLSPGPSLLSPTMQGSNFKRKLDRGNPIENDNDVIFIEENGITTTTNKKSKYEFPEYPKMKTMKLAPASSSGRQGIKICKECGLSFKSQSQLVDHFLTHYNLTLKRNTPVTNQNQQPQLSPVVSVAGNTTKKPHVIYTCNQCTGEFPSITRLRQHQQTVHSEEEAVQCKVCDSWFNSQKYLLRHMQRKHEATAECNVCHQKFTEMELPKHYLKHFNMKL